MLSTLVFSCSIVLPWTSSTYRIGVGEISLPCSWTLGKPFCNSLLNISLSLELFFNFIYYFYMSIGELSKFLFIWNLLTFILWMDVKNFQLLCCINWENHMCFIHCYKNIQINFIHFHMLNQPCIHRLNPTWYGYYPFCIFLSFICKHFDEEFYI